MFTIGTVKDLRKKYKIDKSIPDDSLVNKYGRSDDLLRRTKEHGNDIRLLLFNLIDSSYVSAAELALGYYFDRLDNRLKTTIDKSHIKSINEPIFLDWI